MKVLIRDIGSGFYAKDFGWVKDIRAAQDFENARKAIQYGWCSSLRKVEIHYLYENPKLNFTTGAVIFS